MDSSSDSPKPPLYNPSKKNCEELFDELFKDCDDDDDNGRFCVKKPVKTYSRRQQQLANISINREQSDWDDGDNDKQDDLFEYNNDPLFKKTNKVKVSRLNSKKKKDDYPMCTKDSVLDAFQKAIEMHELPNFDEIEKQELNIVSSDKKSKLTKKSSGQLISRPRRSCVRQYSKNKSKCLKDSNDENSVIDDTINKKSVKPNQLDKSRRPRALSVINNTIELSTTTQSNEENDLNFSLNSSKLSFVKGAKLYTSTPKRITRRRKKC